MDEPLPKKRPADELFEQFYAELRLVARRYMGGERPDHTLQPTALVNEAFVRLARSEAVSVADRVHFLRMAARTMRRVLVDHAKGRGTQRRGGMRTRITLTDDVARNAPEFDLLALDKALDRLEKLSPRQAAIIEMRHIVGLTVEEVAGELDISERTVKGETRVAMAWLRRELDK